MRLRNVATIFATTLILSSCGGVSKSSEQETRNLEKTDSMAIEEVSPSDVVDGWKVNNIENLHQCNLRIEYPSCVFDITAYPEDEDLHRPISMDLTLLMRKENGKKLPIPGQFTLKVGDELSIEGDSGNYGGSQWHIEGDDAVKLMEIMDRGNFTINARNNEDGKIYKLNVINQTQGAKDAYNRLLELYNI